MSRWNCDLDGKTQICSVVTGDGQEKEASHAEVLTRFAALAGVLSLLVFSAVAVAASPHFIGTPQASVSGNALTVTFKAAGLGNVDAATFNLSGTVLVSSRCYTKSGNKPQAANKRKR